MLYMLSMVVSANHRLSIIINADKILAIDIGKIVEQGKHNGLLSHEGVYVKLWALQQHEYLKTESWFFSFPHLQVWKRESFYSV